MRPHVPLVAALGLALAGCSSPPLTVELPPATGPGDRLALVTTAERASAFYLDAPEDLPSFTIDEAARLRVRVFELGATRAELNLSGEPATDAGVDPGRSLLGFRVAQERWVGSEPDAAWTPVATLDEEAARVRLPLSSPCPSLSLETSFTVSATTASMELLPQADAEVLAAVGTAWYRGSSTDGRVTPMESPVDGLRVVDVAATLDGGAWAAGWKDDPLVFEVWRQMVAGEPFVRVHAERLSSTADRALRISAASTRGVFWVSRRGRVVWLEPGQPLLTYVPSANSGISEASIVALSDEEAVALLPYSSESVRERYVVELSRRGGRFEAVTTTVSAGVAFAVGRDADGETWVGDRGSNVVPLRELKRVPRDEPVASFEVRGIEPARRGPWRGLVFFGSGLPLTYRWAGFTETLDRQGFGDCRVEAGLFDIRAVIAQPRGLWLAAREAGVGWRLGWAALR
jgi:hypothetical protein